MDNLPGGSLADRLGREGAQPRARARLAEQGCRGARRCHAEGIVHRYVKPASFLLDGHDLVEVADFGVARPPTSASTEAGMNVGTCCNLAPEQGVARRRSGPATGTRSRSPPS